MADAEPVFTGIVLAEGHMAHIKSVGPRTMARVSASLLKILCEVLFKRLGRAVESPSERRFECDLVAHTKDIMPKARLNARGKCEKFEAG